MGKMEKTIIITPDGRLALGLWDDRLPYRKLGSVSAVRATEVRMNSGGQWEVYIIMEDRVLPDTFDIRGDAILYEIEYLEGKDIKTILDSFEDQ